MVGHRVLGQASLALIFRNPPLSSSKTSASRSLMRRRMSGDRGILLVRCSDRKGVVAAVSGFISDHNGNITSADEHQDQDLNLYFLRLEWTLADFNVDLASFESADSLTPIAREFSMMWSVARSSDRPRVAILVSKSGHCLADLLYRHQIGELPCDIRLVIRQPTTYRKSPNSTA